MWHQKFPCLPGFLGGSNVVCLAGFTGVWEPETVSDMPSPGLCLKWSGPEHVFRAPLPLTDALAFSYMEGILWVCLNLWTQKGSSRGTILGSPTVNSAATAGGCTNGGRFKEVRGATASPGRGTNMMNLQGAG